MNKFFKSVFLLLALVSAQSTNFCYMPGRIEGLVDFVMGMTMYTGTIGMGCYFAHSKAKGYSLDKGDKFIIGMGSLASAMFLASYPWYSDDSYWQNRKEKLETKFAYQQQRLTAIENGKKEDAKSRLAFATLKGKNRKPNFFSEKFGGPIDVVKNMLLPQKRELLSRLDEETSCKHVMGALSADIEDLNRHIKFQKEDKRLSALFIAPAVVPYVVGGTIACGRALIGAWSRWRQNRLKNL